MSPSSFLEEVNCAGCIPSAVYAIWYACTAMMASVLERWSQYSVATPECCEMVALLSLLPIDTTVCGTGRLYKNVSGPLSLLHFLSIAALG